MTDLDHHTLTHLDANGDISMVDVSTKIVTSAVPPQALR